jgi:acylphosphatase
MFSEIHCTVQGRVQGVGYRDFIEGYAKDHALYGWIKNNENGSVEMVLQGTPDELKDCLEAIHQGSLLAKVEALSVDWRTPEKLYDEFRVISS